MEEGVLILSVLSERMPFSRNLNSIPAEMSVSGQ